MTIGLTVLKILWEQLGNIPTDENDLIEEPFTVTDQVFPKGTHREDIWHWFDEKCPNNLAEDLMYINRKGE